MPEPKDKVLGSQIQQKQLHVCLW